MQQVGGQKIELILDNILKQRVEAMAEKLELDADRMLTVFIKIILDIFEKNEQEAVLNA